MSRSPVSPLIGRARPHQLHAVVVDGIVAGGHHDAARHLAMECLEIDLFRAAQADVDRIATFIVQAPNDGLRKGRTVPAHIETHDHCTRTHGSGKSTPQPIGNVIIKFIGHTATDVISLEAFHGQVR
jgi:hypothetical protein